MKIFKNVDKRLKKAERMKNLEKSEKLIDENVKAIAERFVDELKLKELEEALNVEVWDSAPEPVKQYYRFKFKEIDEVYRVVRSMVG